LGAAGEHLVLSKLLLEGFIAGAAPDFTKDFDLVVVSKDGNDSAPIQVKTTRNKSSWIMKKKHESVIDNLIFCFVKVGEQSKTPEIFVIDAATVSDALQKSHEIWLKLPSTTGKPKKDSDMRLLHCDYSKMLNVKKNNNYFNASDKQFLADYSSGWLEKYRDGWTLINNLSATKQGVDSENLQVKLPKEVTGRDYKIYVEALLVSLPMMLRHSLSSSNIHDLMRIIDALPRSPSILDGAELRTKIFHLIRELDDGARAEEHRRSSGQESSIDKLVRKYLDNLVKYTPNGYERIYKAWKSSGFKDGYLYG
jgi:hypothetical protein